MLSLIIPVYKDEENLERLLGEVPKLARASAGLEAVFVVDGSPDRSLEILRERLPVLGVRAQLLALSRNFGSFAAITAGLSAAKGDYLAVMAADLQEPPALVLEFQRILESGEADVVFGRRTGRSDPPVSELFSGMFWWMYRKLIVPELPPGGVDVFGCTREVRDHVVRFREANSSLIVLLFWLGFRRRFVDYERAPRLYGKSAWTFGRKLRYCLNSIFNFSDLPIQLLLYAGIAGMAVSVILAVVQLVAWAQGDRVPGYTSSLLAILFFGGLTSLGLGIVGQYVWLTLQNTRGRPNFVVAWAEEYEGAVEDRERRAVV